jgi:uncharacterized membrane protein YccC
VSSTLASILKNVNRIELAAFAYFIVTGVILLVYLPLTNYAPQLGLLGILSIIVAYGLLTKRGWMPWVLFVLFIGASTLSIYTLVSAGFSNSLLGISLVGYFVLTLLFTIYLLLLRRRP